MTARQRLAAAIALFVLLIAGGTLGYRLIEGWPIADCLYHTVITLSTVGYREIHPLSANGRTFTIVLVMFSVAGTALALASLTSVIIEGQIGQLLWRRRMDREIGKLNDHVVICGYGRMGSFVAGELRRARLEVAIIERDADRLEQAHDDGFLVVEGDATLDAVLLEAGVERASMVVSCLPSDADNVFAVLSIRVLHPNLPVVSRYDEEGTREKLLRAGASAVVSPVQMGGHRLANLVLRPAATELLDRAVAGGELDLRLEEVVLHERSPLAGTTLIESHLRRDHDVMVVAVRSAQGEWTYNPPSTTLLTPGATLVIIGPADEVDRLITREAAAQRRP